MPDGLTERIKTLAYIAIGAGLVVVIIAAFVPANYRNLFKELVIVLVVMFGLLFGKLFFESDKKRP